jgi:hypothetical protein
MTESAEPFRLDDAAPAGKPFPFTFRGAGYVLPPVATWPIGVMSTIARGLVEDALTELLGEAATTRLVNDGMTVGHMRALFETAAKNDG